MFSFDLQEYNKTIGELSHEIIKSNKECLTETEKCLKNIVCALKKMKNLEKNLDFSATQPISVVSERIKEEKNLLLCELEALETEIEQMKQAKYLNVDKDEENKKECQKKLNYYKKIFKSYIALTKARCEFQGPLKSGFIEKRNKLIPFLIDDADLTSTNVDVIYNVLEKASEDCWDEIVDVTD